MKTIKHLNSAAAKDNLELIKDRGYFYWVGTTPEMETSLYLLPSTAVYVCHFTHLSFDQWLEEITIIKDKLKNYNRFSEID